jgi:hypothetical protein
LQNTVKNFWPHFLQALAEYMAFAYSCQILVKKQILRFIKGQDEQDEQDEQDKTKTEKSDHI